SSAASSGGSRGAAGRTTSSSSTTMAIIRRKLPLRSRRLACWGAVSWSRSSRIGSLERRLWAMRSVRRSRRRDTSSCTQSSAAADYIILTDIYAAGEDPIPGATLDRLAAAVRGSVRAPVEVVPAVDDVVTALVRVARPGDLVMTLGAGSIGNVAERFIGALTV